MKLPAFYAPCVGTGLGLGLTCAADAHNFHIGALTRRSFEALSRER